MDWGDEKIKKTYSISSLNAIDTSAMAVQTPVVKSKICPHCGYDFTEFMRTGFLGCSHCYQAFRRELETYLDEFR